MDGLLFKIESKGDAMGDMPFTDVASAVQFYDSAKHRPVCMVVYRGTTVGSIDMDRLRAEFNRNQALAGHPRSY